MIKGNNNEKLSFGGKLVQELIESEDLILANNTDKLHGGPFTRYNPSDPKANDKKSCLDLVIMSKELLKFVDKLIIDNGRKWCPFRPSGQGDVYADY